MCNSRSSQNEAKTGPQLSENLISVDQGCSKSNSGQQQRQQWWANEHHVPYGNSEGTHHLKFRHKYWPPNNSVSTHHIVSLWKCVARQINSITSRYSFFASWHFLDTQSLKCHKSIKSTNLSVSVACRPHIPKSKFNISTICKSSKHSNIVLNGRWRVNDICRINLKLLHYTVYLKLGSGGDFWRDGGQLNQVW